MSGIGPLRRSPEKQVEHKADRLMAALGFAAVRFSQARATMQTPGICDRLYINADRGLHVFYEAKAPGGKQSSFQREFQRLVESQGWVYVVGTNDAIERYAENAGLVKRLPNGNLLRCDTRTPR